MIRQKNFNKQKDPALQSILSMEKMETLIQNTLYALKRSILALISCIMMIMRHIAF